MAASVTLPAGVRQAIVSQARDARPRECCGFLLGVGRRIRYAVAMTNVARGTTRFRIRDADHLALRRLLRKAVPPLFIVGAYHSHPDGEARPSPTDVAEAHYDDWVHIIVGLRPRAELRAFSIRKGRVSELTCRLVSSVDHA